MAGANVLVYVAMLRSLISVRTLKLDLLDQSSAFGRPEGDVQHRAGLHDVMGEVVRMTQLEWLELGAEESWPNAAEELLSWTAGLQRLPCLQMVLPRRLHVFTVEGVSIAE